MNQGSQAEAAARAYFQRLQDYRIIAANYRCPRGEVDLIVEHHVSSQEIQLVFVEVRWRGKGALTNPLESITLEKRRRIERTAQWFLSRYEGMAESIRFDVLGGNEHEWTHLAGAWEAKC